MGLPVTPDGHTLVHSPPSPLLGGLCDQNMAEIRCHFQITS